MSEVVTETDHIKEAALLAETERLIRVAAERNNLPVDVVREQYSQAAREQALKSFEQADSDTSNVYRRLYGDSQDRIRQLEAQLSATQQSRVRSDDRVIVTTAESVQKRDPLAWFKMTPEQRLSSIGVDHTTIDKKELESLFGKKSDHKKASDLMRVDQRRYKTLREAAKVLGIY